MIVSLIAWANIVVFQVSVIAIPLFVYVKLKFRSKSSKKLAQSSQIYPRGSIWPPKRAGFCPSGGSCARVHHQTIFGSYTITLLCGTWAYFGWLGPSKTIIRCLLIQVHDPRTKKKGSRSVLDSQLTWGPQFLMGQQKSGPHLALPFYNSTFPFVQSTFSTYPSLHGIAFREIRRNSLVKWDEEYLRSKGE